MKLPLTPEFQAEAERFGLRRHCEDCVMFDGERAPRDRCAHGYPTEEHVRASETAEIVFCKDFEAA